ncbi:MAG: diaminopimelate decarboxylase [Clostridiales bacterium]|nr:diaminopimelate decarboxylase [Clostridiales bacterium]
MIDLTLSQIREIEKITPTPVHVYSQDEIIKQTLQVNTAFSWNNGFREYYAVKACPTPGIISIMQQLDCGVDCASECELLLAKAMGFTGSQIMFSSNQTLPGEYSLAKQLGAIINLDDIGMIDFIQAECGIPEKICLRFNPGGEITNGNVIMSSPQDSKFGMTLPQVYEAVERCQSLGVKQFALHAFLVSNTTDDSYYPNLAHTLMKLAIDLNKKYGCRIFMLNLSGGIGIPYVPGQKAADLQKIGSEIKKLYDQLLVPSGLGDIAISCELGRYMTGPAGCLLTKAIHLKDTYKHYIGVNACAADLMRPAIYGAYHHITVVGKEAAKATRVYDVVGSLCENNDKFAIDRLLPEVDVGDYIIIHDTGAHGRSMGYNYNGRLRTAELLLCSDGSFKLVRRAETKQDYFATLDVSGLTF